MPVPEAFESLYLGAILPQLICPPSDPINTLHNLEEAVLAQDSKPGEDLYVCVFVCVSFCL